MSCSIGAHGRARPAPSVHARMFDHDLVILDLAGGDYFALDEIGARLWTSLESGEDVAHVATEIAEEYEVAPGRALADLIALADELVARGLLVPRLEPGER